MCWEPRLQLSGATWIHAVGDDMTHGSHRSRLRRVFTKAGDALQVNGWTLNQLDPDGLRYVATVSVRAHWFVIAVLLFEVAYRPYLYFGVVRYVPFPLLLLALAGFNGYFQHRLRSDRPIAWRWPVALYVLDVLVISAVLVLSAGFGHGFMHLFYYPALAGLAVLFTSFRFNMLWVTIVSVVYVALSLSAGDGLDVEAKDEKALLARVVVMYAVVAVVNLATRFERMRWQRALERERVMQNEQVELSQAIHDTAAQSAYMIGMGVNVAKTLADDSNVELTTTLDATSRLCRSLILELRHPINVGGIYEGRELSRSLRLHAASFTNVTLVPLNVTLTGVEPPLSVEVKSALFSVAHNALTNAYRHGEAGNVAIELMFAHDVVSLSVSDDGVGLPDDYAERGNGFANMNRLAQRLGGHLVVEQRGAMGGAAVTCVIPWER